MNLGTSPTDEVKRSLRSALQQHRGELNRETVRAAIAQLASLNPISDPADHPELLQGRWRLISAPNFPGGKRLADGGWCYQLGKLAFQMFAPQDLTLRLDQVFQHIGSEVHHGKRVHNIEVQFTSLDADRPIVSGHLYNLGLCEAANATALNVQFTGGLLEPAADTSKDHWQAVFGQPDNAPSFGQRWQTFVLKLLFGLTPPQSMESDTGQLTFEMQRSPQGQLNILYLDDDLRIMKGRKESITICDRVQ